MAIILHNAKTEGLLESLGYSTNEWTALETGSTDPNVLYVVRPKGGSGFIVNRGLPGAGGVAMQTAELGALGVRRIIHIGTCGLLGPSLNEKSLIVSTGAYKDGGAVLLSDYHDGRVERLSYPEQDLVRRVSEVLKSDGIAAQQALGYTVPVFYFQPAGLIRSLLEGNCYSGNARPFYTEMEQAAFFETAKRMKLQAASIVVGSDRYTVVGGELRHEWLGDTDTLVKQATKAAIEALQGGIGKQ